MPWLFCMPGGVCSSPSANCMNQRNHWTLWKLIFRIMYESKGGENCSEAAYCFQGNVWKCKGAVNIHNVPQASYNIYIMSHNDTYNFQVEKRHVPSEHHFPGNDIWRPGHALLKAFLNIPLCARAITYIWIFKRDYLNFCRRHLQWKHDMHITTNAVASGGCFGLKGLCLSEYVVDIDSVDPHH